MAWLAAMQASAEPTALSGPVDALLRPGGPPPRRVGGPALRGVGHRPGSPGRGLHGRGFLVPALVEQVGLGLPAQDQGRPGAVVGLVVMVGLVRFDRGEDGGAPERILEGRVDVVRDLASLVLPAVDPARAQHRLGAGPEIPVGDVDLVAGQLGHEALRVLPVEAPVHEMVEGRIAPARGVEVRRGRLFLAAPGAVPMPHEARVVDLAQAARLDDPLVGGLVDRIVEALVADLEQATALLRRLLHATAALGIPGHHLLAEDVLARLQAARGDLGVQPERQGEDDRFEVLLLEHRLPVVVVLGRRRSCLGQHLVGLLEPARVDVAHGPNRRVRRVGLAEKDAALAAQAHVAHPDRSAPNGSPGERGRAQSGQGRGGGHRFEEVAPSQLLLFGGEVHDASASVRAASVPVRSRSRPAIRPVRKLQSTRTAAASIRFLLTMR